ncbi:MAG TPA: co-chaperone GroES [Bacteroidetes bacterium]|nr:10 kDa chaperonin 1 [bacterium BMS3Bbin04]HDO66012.1 co-chaperone GroES [Bacteroidota bacterium]HEX05137.1 co-chaperone GroES [Bacteroidota bacterium]
MNVRPIDERVLLKVVEKDEKSAGGIIIPDTVNKERPQVGEVIALGDDIVNKDLERKPLSQIVSVGDQVLFAKYGGTEVTVDDEDYLLVNRTDILGVLEK